jgi:hypothetical protein
MEFAESFYKHLKDRLTSPLWGVFALAWFYYNWKAAALFLLSSEPIAARIALIELHHSDVYPNLIYPFAFSFLFVLAYPWFAFPGYWMQEFADVLKRKERYRLERGAPFRTEERIELETRISHFANENAQLNQQVIDLRRTLLDVLERIGQGGDTESGEPRISKSELAQLRGDIERITRESRESPKTGTDAAPSRYQQSNWYSDFGGLKDSMQFRNAMQELTRVFPNDISSLSLDVAKYLSVIGAMSLDTAFGANAWSVTEKGRFFLEQFAIKFPR